MGIIGNTIKEKVNYGNQQYADTSTAKIIDYDITSNRASIQYVNPIGGGKFIRQNVPVLNTLGGLQGTGISPGDIVSIIFRNGNLHAPVITGLLSNHYMQKNMTDQGATLVDSDISDVNIPEEITPMYEQWLDTDNENELKYNNDYTEHYMSTDIDGKSIQMVREITHFSGTEQGIVHLDNNSCIRMRDNGDIDIFAGNNTGIRISKNKGLQLYGKTNMVGGMVSSVQIDTENTDAIIQANTDDEQIMQYSSQIAETIEEIEAKVKELAEIIEQLVIITRNPAKWQTLNDIIARFNALKNRYRAMIVGTTLDEIRSMYLEMVNIKITVNEEYDSSQGILNGTGSI